MCNVQPSVCTCMYVFMYVSVAVSYHYCTMSVLLGDKLEGYQKKKYVCKLLFMFLLGNDINFGYQEAVNLLSSIKFTEKQIVSQSTNSSCQVKQSHWFLI